jgi:hypothetical protein
MGHDIILGEAIRPAPARIHEQPTRRSTVQINHSAKIEIRHSTTFGEIFDAVTDANIPREARVTVDMVHGDARDPGTTNIGFMWSTESD